MKSDKKTRIRQEQISLDQNKIKGFFDGRAKKELRHRYNIVNFHDNDPEIVLERDKAEKLIIRKYIHFRPGDLVLDIGCGVGRWGDTIVPLLKDGRYVGVDYSDEMLKIARDAFQGDDRAIFLNGSFQEAESRLTDSGCTLRFDKILVNGVLMYINDLDIIACLESVDRLLRPGGFFYLKETVGVNERLSLDEFFSEDMVSNYSAIYRSVKEYTAIIRDCFLTRSYSLISCGPSWNENFEEDKETYNTYWVLRKY